MCGGREQWSRPDNAIRNHCPSASQVSRAAGNPSPALRSNELASPHPNTAGPQHWRLWHDGSLLFQHGMAFGKRMFSSKNRLRSRWNPKVRRTNSAPRIVQALIAVIDVGTHLDHGLTAGEPSRDP